MSSPFDFGGLGNLGALLGGFQQRLETIKQKAAQTEVEGVAGGGIVRVRMKCDLTVSAVSIDPAAMDDRDLLEDLLRAAMGDATAKARAEMGRSLTELTGGLPIPPGLFGF